MPRAASTSTEEKTVKKAPRKRATPNKPTTPKKVAPRKPTTRKASPKKTTTRKKPTKKVTEEEVVNNPETEAADVEKDMSSNRKAPTKFAIQQAAKKSKRNQYIVIVLLISAGVGASAAVGLSDSQAGQINVAQTIKERNERMANLVDVDGPTTAIPIPSRLPDGGLVGLQREDSATPLPPRSTSTSTSTNAGQAATTTAATTATTTMDSAVRPAGQDITAGQLVGDTATTTVEPTDPTADDQFADNNTQ